MKQKHALEKKPWKYCGDPRKPLGKWIVRKSTTGLSDINDGIIYGKTCTLKKIGRHVWANEQKESQNWFVKGQKWYLFNKTCTGTKLMEILWRSWKRN